MFNAVLAAILLSQPAQGMKERLGAPGADGDMCTQVYELSSPCRGILLPHSAAAEGIQCLTIKLPKAQAKLVLMEGWFKATTAYHVRLTQLRDSQTQALHKLLEIAVEKHEPSFWARKDVVLVAGLVLGAAIATGTTWAVTR